MRDPVSVCQPRRDNCIDRSLTLLLLLALPLVITAAPRTCLVVGVSDGDTLRARCGQPGSYEEGIVTLPTA